MATLFIIGNGFDIAHGIPSKYYDFREFVIKLYPEALKYRDEAILIDDMADIDSKEFAAEILLTTMDKVSGYDWSNFEDALAYVNFNHKFPLPNHRDDETDDEDNELMLEYLMYMDALSSAYVSCSTYWQVLFSLWIKDIQTHIDNKCFDHREGLREMFSDPDTYFLTFNYTKTLQRLYGVRKVIHIHNFVGQKLIFGHGQDDAFYGQLHHELNGHLFLGSSSLDNLISSFRKDTNTPCRTHRTFFRQLDDKIDRVYSYGFSYGEVDSVYIKEIVNRISSKATWFFTSFEAKDNEAILQKQAKLRSYGFNGLFDVYEG